MYEDRKNIPCRKQKLYYIISILYDAWKQLLWMTDHIKVRFLSNSYTRFELYKYHHLLARAKKKALQSFSMSRSYCRNKRLLNCILWSINYIF